MPRKAPDPAGDEAWLFDMLGAARAVSLFVAGKTTEQYRADELLRSAVERKVEIIGEAARNISQRFKTSHSEIPWRQIMAQRHRLAHEYGDVDDDLIWEVATVHVPALVRLLEPLIPPLPPDSGGTT